jgi:HEAT repeat protein
MEKGLEKVEALRLQVASEIIAAHASKGVFGSKEQVYEQLMGLVGYKEKDWKIAKLGIEKASEVIDSSIAARKLDVTTQGVCQLLGDENLKGTAIDFLAKMCKIAPEVVGKYLQSLLHDPERDVKIRASEALRTIVNLVGETDSKEVLALLKPLLRDPDRDVKWSATEALRAIVNLVGETDSKEVLALLKPLLRDPDRDVKWSATKPLRTIVKLLRVLIYR